MNDRRSAGDRRKIVGSKLAADGADAEQHGHDHDDGHSHMVHLHRDVQGGTARAVVFGISDGLVSNTALILGVAAAASTGNSVVVAGVAGLLAGASSMAAGEYVSMKAQAELVERELEIERRSIAEQPEAELDELAAIYTERGIDPEQARAMSLAVMKDPGVALSVHAREELGIDPDGVGDPAVAASSSFVAFAVGALIPLIPWFLASGSGAIVASAVLGLTAAGVVGVILARFTERSMVRTARRQMAWALGAFSLTWVIGSILGQTVS